MYKLIRFQCEYRFPVHVFKTIYMLVILGLPVLVQLYLSYLSALLI
jgi:ABC-type arginine/histidine transport system permease subunit